MMPEAKRRDGGEAVPMVLCADDYGLSPAASLGIRRLLEAGRLSATSCMTLSPSWPEHAARLKEIDPDADIGLHLTLTEYAPLGAMPGLAPSGRLPPLPELMRRAALRHLDRAEIAAEAARQVDAFEQRMGRRPDFLDGHQHVHQLPVIRDVVLDLLERRLGRQAYVRTCQDAPGAILARGVAVPKTLLIAGLGVAFRRAVRRAAIPTNRSFRGVYDFSDRVPFGSLIERFLAAPVPGMLVMCHPGDPAGAAGLPDAIAAQRAVEFDYLRSDAFSELLSRRGVRLARFAPAPLTPG